MQVLVSKAVPATVFVTGTADHQGACYWWDELEQLLLLPGELPDRLEIAIGGEVVAIQLGTAALYSTEQWQPLRDWRAWFPPPTERHTLYIALAEKLKRADSREQRRVMEELRSWAGREPLESHGRMRDDEIVRIGADGLIDIGGHTASHPMLSALRPELQRVEIRENKVYLEALLGRSPKSFAYPYGDYEAGTPPRVREEGFVCACITGMASVTETTDPYRLPRHHAYDLDAGRFAEWLERLFEG